MDPRQTTTQHPAAAGASPSQWPGGWYVYENGRVDGPFTADEAFALDAETSDGKPRLVSRKGFSQWYALRDLSEIFRMTAHLGRKAEMHGLMSEAQLAGIDGRPSPLASGDGRKAAKVRGRRVETAAPGNRASAPTSTMEAAPAPAAVRSAWPAALASPDAKSQRAPRVAQGERAEAPRASARDVRKPRPLAPAKAKAQALMQEYFLARGRLRLGKLRSPWVAAFLGVPFTLGGMWLSWFGTLAREVAMHSRNTDRTSLPPTALALVPFVHFYMVYKLSLLINEMEAQNRYRRVSAPLATVLAVLPPVAMVYLQDAVNRHWMLHAQHALTARQTPAAPTAEA